MRVYVLYEVSMLTSNPQLVMACSTIWCLKRRSFNANFCVYLCHMGFVTAPPLLGDRKQS